ncbi:DUF4232 domain-containing protein [Streptomyces sp. NPDC059788]|uniref:DUF4232 domain-containing protein n=1 Tax=Streptomyces sp. NPDC059788 TaxID=3346948 RepID=UPI0036622684
MRFHRPTAPRPARRRAAVRGTALLTTITAALVTLPTAAATASAAGPAAPTTAKNAPAPRCAESALTVSASVLAAHHPDVLRIGVTNRGAAPCAVDRIPTVTFGDLDGAAEPDPPAESAPYRLAPGATAYATVRTVTGAPAPAARTVGFVTVAADPSHHGRRFDAAALGAPPTGIRVWSPTTTWWRPTPA